MHQNSVFAVLM